MRRRDSILSQTVAGPSSRPPGSLADQVGGRPPVEVTRAAAYPDPNPALRTPTDAAAPRRTILTFFNGLGRIHPGWARVCHDHHAHGQLSRRPG